MFKLNLTKIDMRSLKKQLKHSKVLIMWIMPLLTLNVGWRQFLRMEVVIFHQQHEIGILMTSLCLPKYRNCMNERFLSNVISKSFGEKTCTIELLLLLLIFTKLLKRNNFNYIFFDYYIFLLSLYLHVLFQVTRSLT